MNHPLPDLMSGTMSKIREMIGANAIVGDPIVTADQTTIIPISKVSFGFAGAGSDFVPKARTSEDMPFGGGTGAGVNITPIAFLVCKGESVRMIPITSTTSTGVDRLIEQVPELVDRVLSLIEEKRTAAKEKEE